MVLEFERFPALVALELALIRAVLVVVHVPLELGQIGKLLRTHGTGLRGREGRRGRLG